MSTNKNQHYVPRCYLKAFTDNSENKTINVYNLDRKKCIPLAAVKKQCSKNYFYGTDDKLEQAIQTVESAYASTLRDIISTSRNLNESQKVVLKRFWLLQYLRTEASSKRAVEMSNDISEVIGVHGEAFNLGIKEAVLMAMKTYAHIMDIVDDLKICLISNETKFPFITSDDPAVLSNRWYLNDDRTRFKSFGLRASGNLLLLPLTPKIMCVAYDSDVYSITHKKGWRSITSINEVKAFNQHQLLNCRANIFVKKFEHRSFVHESFEEIEVNRTPERHRINYAVFDFKDGEYSRYRVIEPEAKNEHEDVIIHAETLHSLPTFWPNILRWRNNGAVYTNGTGVGYLRKYHTLPDPEGFCKEPVKLRKKHP